MATFRAGDLVFAKMRGFPHWPARVCSADDSNKKKRMSVFFFGTHQVGMVLRAHVVPYAGNQARYGGPVRMRGFAQGLWEIQHTPGVGRRHKSLVAQRGKLPQQSPAKAASASADQTAEAATQAKATTAPTARDSPPTARDPAPTARDSTPTARDSAPPTEDTTEAPGPHTR
ncbi:hypothetical protein CRUP_019201, partial [Coryphaenoides rupestris]